MARRRRSRRPWYRTRAYRLTRTFVLTVTLVTGGVWWAGEDDPTGPVVADDAAGHGGAAAYSGPAHSGPARADSEARGANSRRTGRDARGAKSGRRARPRPTPTPPPHPLPPSPATSLRIPYLGLEAPAVGLRLDGERRLTAPPVDDPHLVGWYEGGPTPGASGTAVVVGHRDTRTGPAVFAALGLLHPGRVVEARRSDGRTAVYTVDAVKTYEKARFPNKEVYGDRGRPELRLITCGGVYDRRTGYAGNIVVFAHLTQTRGRTRTM